ncbi:MAG: hypothetical protein WCQ90_07795 [Deltaproteobacteria bacterium]
MIVKDNGFPVQLAPEAEVYEGVTVIVAIIGLPELFIVVKGGIFPVPVALSPIEGSELAQLKIVPATGPLKLTDAFAPAHTNTLLTGFTEGIGMISAVIAVLEALGQLPVIVLDSA